VFRRAVVALPAVLAVILSAPASAEECHDSNTSYGQDTLYLGPSGSNQHLFWTIAGRELGMTVNTGNIQSDVCLDAWYDWSTYSGHFDERVVRVCRQDSTRSTPDNYYEAASEPPYFAGIQKGAACRFNGSFLYDCVQSDKAQPGCPANASTVEEIIPNTGTRGWLRKANGTVDYFGGGDPTSDNS
jgi:hypothetical protein